MILDTKYSQQEAGDIHELRRLLSVLVTATEREKFLRNLLRLGIGTKVLEDKAGGMVLEQINVMGGFGACESTRATNVRVGGRCY